MQVNSIFYIVFIKNLTSCFIINDTNVGFSVFFLYINPINDSFYANTVSVWGFDDVRLYALAFFDAKLKIRRSKTTVSKLAYNIFYDRQDGCFKPFNRILTALVDTLFAKIIFYKAIKKPLFKASSESVEISSAEYFESSFSKTS